MPTFKVIEQHDTVKGFGWMIKASWSDGYDELLIGVYTSFEAARERLGAVSACWLQSLPATHILQHEGPIAWR